MTFPKVLIIGQPLNKKNGGGITLSNLFKGWPKDRLAVASNINLRNDPDFSTCEIYYQLGYKDKLHPFPLNILLPKIKCGITDINISVINEMGKNKTGKSSNFKKIHSFLTSFLKFWGIYNFFYKLKITQEFKVWVTAYNPDIIYSQLSTLELIRFVDKLKTLLNKPIAIHIMDDWPSKIGQQGLFNFYWKRISIKEFKQLIDKSSVLMSISGSMSEEYKKRYNKSFIPFHNPIEIDKWLPYARNQWKKKDIFNILYTGRIGTANSKSIMVMANVIDFINSKENKIKLDIFTPDIYSKKGISMNNLRGVEIKNTIQHTLMPSLLASYDLLFLPLDFDKAGIIFSQFSMPTKVSEYMISGTPILVFADKRTALAKYALQDNWAFVVSENNRNILIDALNELITNQELRMKLSAKAKEIATKNENAQIVRDNFRKVLSQT